ncbi:hypothetical protein TNCV_1645271 [Trichonephila clavipes]|nr:hypothetical protein TNCV_1645271 [Trichonephila clavipes]
MTSTSSSVSTVSTSSSSTQAHLLPSTCAIIPTIQRTETRPLITSSKVPALSTEIQLLDPLLESVPTTSNSEHSNAPDPSGGSPFLDPHPDAVALHSGCTPGKRRAWVLPDDRHTASLVGLRGGWRNARMKFFTRIYGSNATVPG